MKTGTKILGIETSCDECAAAVIEDGKNILSNVVASQIEFHRPYYGVVPEIASRKHVEWIHPVVSEALKTAKVSFEQIDAVAVTFRPGLIGSLLVGLSFAKGLALTRDLPFVGVDHIQAHLYSPHLVHDVNYPYIGLIVSGGHTLIARTISFDNIEIMGTTIDDACGEALDKVAKHYDMGYPGGVAIERLSKDGNPRAFQFPKPSLHKGEHRYDVSYSGLKTAAINQLDQFRDEKFEKNQENIAASFQRAAIDMIVEKTVLAAKDTGIGTIVVGGGVSANMYMRDRFNQTENIRVLFPPLELCTDNAAMVGGLAYPLLRAGKVSSLDLNAEARVSTFRRIYP
jgi:N6-L-threonylcarbamoyladenine synthase